MDSTERVERLLAAILLQSMRGTTMKEKAVLLSTVGFSNVEIADFLETSAQVVAQLLYEAHKQKPKRKRSR